MSGTIPAGAVNDSLVSHYDVLPTILEMTGVDNPETELLPGRSFAARLRGASGGHEAVVACDEYGSENLVCSSIRKNGCTAEQCIRGGSPCYRVGLAPWRSKTAAVTTPT